MNQYTFTGLQRTVLLAGIVLGVLCMGLTWMVDDELHTRFWTNLLHNSVFYTGMALMATFFIAICVTAWAGWYSVFKRVWEAFTVNLAIGCIMMAFIGLSVYMNWNHLYHWMDVEAVIGENDKVLIGKLPFLNKSWYFFGGIVIMVVWCFFAYMFRKLSLLEDKEGKEDTEYKIHAKLRVYAAAFLPFAGFSSAAVIWLWIMSLDAHWYSTLFAWYSAASWFVAMMALTILVIIFMKGRGNYELVTDEHLHDLGKFMFAFSIFWTYLWFSQYMLIWYSNNGEETIYFRNRFDNYEVLFYGNLVINFLVPFFVLMRNSTKRKYGTLIFVAVVVIFGHWLDYFLMIKPGALINANHLLGVHGAPAGHAGPFVSGFSMPGFLELGTFIGFLSAFLYVVFSNLSKTKLLAEYDPYIEESLHHHV